jgi:RecB family endonuclease NucS
MEGFLCDVEEDLIEKRFKMSAVRRNVVRKGIGRFEFIAVDANRVLVVEVKNKLDKQMVDRFIEKKLPRFKAIFPEYEKCQVVGAMGALVVKDDVGRYAEKAGLYVLTQTDEGGATLLNRKGFEPRTFN